MDNYRVRATIRKNEDPATEEISELRGKHPDLIKVAIEAARPGYRIHRILQIADLRPAPRRWDER